MSGANIFIKRSGVEPSSIVLVGNGAIDRGNEPIILALHQLIDAHPTASEIVKRLRKEDTEIFHTLASLSYQHRIVKANHYANWRLHYSGSAGGYDVQYAETLQDPYWISFLNLRKTIASYYNQAEFLQLRLNDQKTKRLFGENPLFITTNWDRTIWNAFENVIHIHGRCEVHDSLIFPTELVVEETLFDFQFLGTIASDASTKFTEEIRAAYRPDHITSFFKAYVEAGVAIREAKKIVIWGYSLSDYDADVNSLLGQSKFENNPELLVVNPDPYAFQRAVALTGITNASHFNPQTEVTLKFST